MQAYSNKLNLMSIISFVISYTYKFVPLDICVHPSSKYIPDPS